MGCVSTVSECQASAVLGVMSCPALAACSVHSRPPCSEDVTLCALRTKTLHWLYLLDKILEQLFPAARLMWSGPLVLIDFENILLWAVNANLWRTTNEVVRIVNCQNMIWAEERRHEQPVTRITQRGKHRSENSFDDFMSNVQSDEWNLEEQCKLDVDLESWGPLKE